jgi:hypothetical protein
MQTSARDALAHKRRPDADDADCEDDAKQADAAMAAGGDLDVALGLQDQPVGAQQGLSFCVAVAPLPMSASS